VRLLEWSSLSV